MKVVWKAALIISAISLSIGLGGCASCSRGLKSLDSDFGGGLNRTVTLYDYNGKVLKTWEGKIDLSNSENEFMFDLNDKRVIIHGGIAVVEEN